MEEKKSSKVGIFVLVSIILLASMAVLGYYIYELKHENKNLTTQSELLQTRVEAMSNTLDKIESVIGDASKDETKETTDNTVNNENKIENKTVETENKVENKTDKTESNVPKEKYTDVLSDAINGKTAFIELESNGKLQTEKKDGFYSYVDPFNNTYNIKDIVDVSSEDGMMSNNNFLSLFEVKVKYIDNNNVTQTMNLAITLNTDHEVDCRGTYDNYTGSTSFVRAFSSSNDYFDGQNY